MPALVALDLPGGEAFVTALRRAWDDGDAVLPLDRRLARAAQERVLDDLGIGAVVTETGVSRRRAGRPVEPGDALVMATSGTTGTPKGVILTHAAVAASAAATSVRLGLADRPHRWLACLPLNHVGGLTVITKALHTEAALTVLPGFDVGAVTAASGPDVAVSLVPTALRRIGANRFLTVVLGGSAPPTGLPSNVHPTYGLTETGSGVVYDGFPLAGVDVAISDAGEIRVRGPMLLRAYRASDPAGRPACDAEGWLATGDSGCLDSDGRLHVHGRLSDLIVTGGENVWPEPVERLLAAHPGVAEVGVAGRPDPEWGQRVVAWVVPESGVDPPGLAELRALVADGLAAFAAPRELVLTDTLPRTSLGKIRRGLLGPPSGSPEWYQPPPSE